MECPKSERFRLDFGQKTVSEIGTQKSLDFGTPLYVIGKRSSFLLQLWLSIFFFISGWQKNRRKVQDSSTVCEARSNLHCEVGQQKSGHVLLIQTYLYIFTFSVILAWRGKSTKKLPRFVNSKLFAYMYSEFLKSGLVQITDMWSTDGLWHVRISDSDKLFKGFIALKCIRISDNWACPFFRC